MNRADYRRRLTELESAKNTQAADDNYEYERLLQTIFMIDPVITELMRNVARDPVGWLESPQAKDPMYSELVDYCRSEDTDLSFNVLLYRRTKRAGSVLGDDSLEVLMAAVRCNLQIDGPEMNPELLARFRARVLASPETVNDIYPHQFEVPDTRSTIARRVAEIKARRHA